METIDLKQYSYSHSYSNINKEMSKGLSIMRCNGWEGTESDS